MSGFSDRSKDWECHCGKYKRIRYKGVICDRCGVEVTKAKVRRERMGHIELAAPVSHIWDFKGIPSRMGLILDIPPRTLEKILYFAAYIVLDAGNSTLQYKQLLTESEYRQEKSREGVHFRAAMGAEAIQELLAAIDLEKEMKELSEELVGASGQKRIRILKRSGSCGVLLQVRQSSGVDDYGCCTGNSPGSAPDGSAGRRKIRDLRSERSVSPCD